MVSPPDPERFAWFPVVAQHQCIYCGHVYGDHGVRGCFYSVPTRCLCLIVSLSDTASVPSHREAISKAIGKGDWEE